MKPLSRRHFCVSTALGPLLFAAAPFAPANAQIPPLDPNADLPAQTLHAIGVRMLREGRTFDKAAERFRAAIQKEPNDPAHHIALGCALASRAASVSYAAAFTQMLQSERTHYAQSLQKWEQGRADFDKMKAQDPKAFAAMNYDDSKPKLPPARDFVTKDDQVPFRLTPRETATLLATLCRDAQAAWVKGNTLSKTPDEKAQAYYIQAWGLRILQQYLSEVGEGGINKDVHRPEAAPDEKVEGLSAPFKTLPGVPTLADAQKTIEESVRLAPQNPLYQQALGDFLMSGQEEKALAAYEKAATLSPKNVNVLYLLYQKSLEKALNAFNTGGYEKYQKGEVQKPNAEPLLVPLGYLHKAQARDRANAWPLYEEAGILFRLAPYSITGPSGNRDATPAQKQAALDAVLNDAARKKGKQALDRIVQGNAAPRYDIPKYKESVPLLLTQAWQYTHRFEVNFNGFGNSRELDRSAIGYAQVMQQHENNAGEAVRANRASIGMGFRMVGDWPTEDDAKTGKTMIEGLVGVAICAIGYKGLMRTYEAMGDKAALDAATRENADFQARVTEYKKAVTARMSIYSGGGTSYDAY